MISWVGVGVDVGVDVKAWISCWGNLELIGWTLVKTLALTRPLTLALYLELKIAWCGRRDYHILMLNLECAFAFEKVGWGFVQAPVLTPVSFAYEGPCYAYSHNLILHLGYCRPLIVSPALTSNLGVGFVV